MKKGKMGWILAAILAALFFAAPNLFAAYHHEGESDAAKFLTVYPDKQGTKLDHCALCHCGGEYEKKPGKWITLGSCQWCHYSYGYDGQAGGTIQGTLNPYGQDYHDNGRSTAAIQAIANQDSDGDTYSNLEEIQTNWFPGNAADHPGLIPAPRRIYTRAQLLAMPQHTQFMLMNTSRSGDFYAQYSGVILENLLADAGTLPTATEITVYAPDGWAQVHPLDEVADPELYHVNGAYPEAAFHYDQAADEALNPDTGWCDYSAPSVQGRNNGDPIVVQGGLRTILATKREGQDMDAGVLNQDNKLDGEGPFRVVPPQKNPTPPDQSSNVENWDGIWPYNFDWDHNAGAASRSATIIKVGPLPDGTTDIDVMEAGWAYVDQAKIVIYGAIDGSDSNGNGVLDSEEKVDDVSDFNDDGIPDYQDPKTARVRHANGIETVLVDVSAGAIANMKCLDANDPAVPIGGRPGGMVMPYGTFWYDITGLDPNDPEGEIVTVTMVFPGNIPTDAKLFKITATNGWVEIPFESNDGDNIIEVILQDGDPATDADGVKNGTIVDPVAPAVTPDAAAAAAAGATGSGSSSCFIEALR